MKIIGLIIGLLMACTFYGQEQMEIIQGDLDSDGNIPHAVLSIKNNNYSRMRIEAYSDTWFRNGQIEAIRGRGTFDNPQDLLPGDRVFGTYTQVYNNNMLNSAPITSIEHYVGSQLNSGLITFATLNPNSTFRDEHMRINEFGNIGIGTSQPNSKLQIKNGDIYIEDINSGVIMKSPNGNCWRLTVDDSGNPVFNSISCP